MARKLPLLGITMGDPTGAGPEIIVKALASHEVQGLCHSVVIGDAGVMRAAAEIVGIPAEIRVVPCVSEVEHREGVINLIDLKNVNLSQLVRGRVALTGGAAAYAAVEAATKLALAGEIHAVVTAPLNKEALNLAGYHYSGHTEILAHLTGTKNVVMMLAARNLRVAHVTTHVSLRRALALVTRERILTVLRLTNEGIQRMGIVGPHLAVAGLNPHAGEGGLFGNEEVKEIVPAIEAARLGGIKVTGPLPPDTVFLRTLQGQFDGAIAMYHDQGHIPMKMVAFDEGVNITLGLPFIRTSVDHGTVFGKAGKGTADPRSLVEAIKLATEMSLNPFS